MSKQFEFGMIGLGTMGRSLAFNLADHGYPVAGLAEDAGKAAMFDSQGKAEGEDVKGFANPKEFIQSLKRPRPIMLLVPAGAPVDAVIAELKPLLEPDDLIIDGGNSYFKDTERRAKDLDEAKIGFFGMGVSGGESGARHGPSMMPGGNARLWERVQTMLEKVSAKAEDGEPCVALMGPGGSGHYVKMVHNGIEYAIMQGISEIYDVLRRGLGMSCAEISDIFGEWDQGELKGFLVQITHEVLAYVDPGSGKHLVDLISDKAKQKGTGKWTSQDAMDLGIPVPSIDISVAARELSGMKDDRVKVSKIYSDLGLAPIHADAKKFVKEALHLTMILAYAQGFSQLQGASIEYKYGLDMEKVAKIWRAGCIIRSAFLQQIMQAYRVNSDLDHLLLDPSVATTGKGLHMSLRKLIGLMNQSGIPSPMLSASLAYFDGLRSEKMPSNLIQAQRDYFGAHTYERIDQPGSFHTQWSS